MCDSGICTDVLVLLDNHDERVHSNVGLQLNKREIQAVIQYVATWAQRQCMCCYKDFKNIEKLNNLIQTVLRVAIRLIQTLPSDIQKEIDKAKNEEDKNESKEGADKSDEKEEEEEKEEEISVGDNEYWTVEEKEKLIQFITKVFLMNFPLYMAYKHFIHTSLEELSTHETSALNNYCEISDPDVPLYLLRNVCFFCDTNGIQALENCFEKASPETLPFNFAHLLIHLIANLRLWMNVQTVMQCIIPLRSAVIRYVCSLSDRELRNAGSRNMTELMWAAVKEPLDNPFSFDREGLQLGFKYFTCTTLTIRLAGIAQINNQINLYNESCNNETFIDAESVGNELAQWLIDNKIVEHIFGPNLHVEIIKQSQMILNFLAMEGRITNEHIDCIWAASQLKHCGKQVYDILIPLIKNLHDLSPVRYLLKLVSSLEISAHTESTLYLASALIKCIWNTCATGHTHGVTTQQLHPQLQSTYTALQREESENKGSKHVVSSSEESEGYGNRRIPPKKCCSGMNSEELELGECCPHQHHHPHHQHLKHGETGESDSSLDGNSELSVGSEDSGCDESDIRLHHKNSKFRLESKVKLVEESDSEIEVSDSSGSPEKVKEKRKGKRVRQITVMRLVRNENVDTQSEESCMDDCEHCHDEDLEEGDSEFMDSEEEKIDEVNLMLLKQCERESEESSDFETDEEKVKKLQEIRRQCEAQQLINKQRKARQAMLRQAMIQSQGRVSPNDDDNQQGPSSKQADDKKMEETIEISGDKDTENNEIQPNLQKQDSMTSSQKSDAVLLEATAELEASVDADTSISKSEQEETEIYDCREVIQRLQQAQQKHKHLHSDFSEGIMSPDDGSCHSSRISTKSEKNMADFDGEEGLSEEELVQISANAHFNQQQMHEHLSSLYTTHVPRAVIHHRPIQRDILPSTSQMSCCNVTFDDVCTRGNTLLWDLVQEDVAYLLPEGLAVEAEKALLNTLVCGTTDKRIKLKFIAACIENVANHRSVVISLRLLPRIFNSIPRYRNGSVTMWAENNLNMMDHFFNDLVHYTNAVKEGQTSPNALYCHREEVLVRLQFLICVFSTYGSPDIFRLSERQVDILWNCLATDEECADDCLHWFLDQAKSKDFHALGVETFKHIFLEKMPQLEPESTSMISLNLFQQLSHLARFANNTSDKPLTEDQVSGMDQLWNIALRARNKDVSMSAIQYINNYYIGYGNGLLHKEEEFVKRCMKSLVEALGRVREDPKVSLLVLQKGLTLLKNHLEAFRRRYAFHLRNWQIDSCGIHSHQQHRFEKQPSPIRILLQPGGMSDKTQLEMMTTDLVAELRAEVTRWWEDLQKQQQQQRQQLEGSHGIQLSPILGSMLHDGPIRMITLGQELTVDTDEKTIGEMQFKDLQLVFVSVGASRQPKKMDGSVPASSLLPPARDKLPMILLLQEPHFDNLFMLLEQLSNLDTDLVEMDCQEMNSLQTEARRLSRSVWELLMILPTSEKYLDGFKSIMTESNVKEEDKQCVDWNTLLPPSSPHRLYYSLQIVEYLSHRSKLRRKSVMRSGGGDAFVNETESIDNQHPDNIWSSKFISKGGLSHLFNIFMNGSLQPKEGDVWSQWNQECLAYLLRLMSQFAVGSTDGDTGFDDGSYESPRKKIKKQKGLHEKIIIPRLNQATVNDLNVESVLKILMQILYEAALPEDNNQLYLGSWGRAEVVHYALSFLVSLAYSCDEVHCLLCSSPTFTAWLKRLTLEAPEPYVRKEACMGLYRLCLGKTIDDKSGYNFILPILSNLLDFLADALQFKPQKSHEFESQKDKEPYGPGCRDYFFLVCRFVDSISKEDAKREDGPIDLNDLAMTVSEYINHRCIYESRSGIEEDDGLVGLINLCTAIIKHDPPFKHSSQGQQLLDEIFNDLFSLPSPAHRGLPKCKSQSSRSAAYDLIVELVKGSVDNYKVLHAEMMIQHSKDSHAPYPWDYWPHEDGRSKCGYVGLTNLGATCYMATCMQHLYMIPQARETILKAKCTGNTQHEGTLIELQKMFAYLQESERKAYNPKSFCKAYTMDKQPLNTGEQKDMTEFFTDLISKLEEMSTDMRILVKTLFGGVLTNNVVSLDCPHVSRTFEEFYTVRCQVTDMKDLYESLDEVTVKDMLEGDNMYTCSKCMKKVRAEKRACFRKLPRILCFNTMRYTFNMITMMKEKVNTLFSFPLKLDMSPYMESNLMGADRMKDSHDYDEGLDCEEFSNTEEISCEYELIGVTVHTGTADGGHYYSFIRDRLNKTDNGQDKWFLFNDAEVKPWDPSQIASECFGGEMTSKTYDSVTDKFMDFSFEKTNSAYMLFYESCPPKKNEDTTVAKVEEPVKYNFELSHELSQWIWQDNTQFLQDKNLFEHNYFGFMWQICGYIPTTLKDENNEVGLKAAQLSLSFVLETMIHSKEKPTMIQWIELLTKKQFNACPQACEWSLDHMTESDWWPQQILIKCPNQIVRQMFKCLVIHIISQLRSSQVELYMEPIVENEDGTIDVSQLGQGSCVTRFIRKMLTIIEHGVRPHSKYLSEYFAFLLEFAKAGNEEAQFLIHINAISTMVTFYMGQKAQENYVEILSDDEEEEDVISLTDDNYRPISLEKMITLIALLVEKARTNEKRLRLSNKDKTAIMGGKGFPFLFNQIRDNINIRETCNLIFNLTRWNGNEAVTIVNMIFAAIKKLTPELSQPFFKLLSLLVDYMGAPAGTPHYTQYILHKFWELAKACPQQCLEWLAGQVTRNKAAQAWCLSQMDLWVECYLIAHSNLRVRNAAAYLLVALVPSVNFRQAYRPPRSYHSPLKEIVMSTDARLALNQIYSHLLSLLSRAKAYVDPQVHGTTKLTCYFAVLTYCLNSRAEKLMFSEYFIELWQLFHPKLSEPNISMHHNKQVLLLFWHQVCVDCVENIRLIVNNPHVCKNIAFNYILADHDDQDVVMFNKLMLPSYYGLLRMCCQQDRNFTRLLAQHQNIQWAFKNITPYPAQYTVAVEELFRMMKLMAAKNEDTPTDEIKAINAFRHSTLSMYLSVIDARSMWQTLISAFKLLVESQEEKLDVVFHGGLQMITEAFNTLHAMFYEATACHVTGDIVDLLTILLKVLETAREIRESRSEISSRVKTCFAGWKERMEFVKKILTLLNSYTPPEVRQVCFDLLKQMVLTFQGECISTIIPILTAAHTVCQDNSLPVVTGPYFPRRGQKPFGSKSTIRPPRPQFMMCLNTSQIEHSNGVDEVYDQALTEFFQPYHMLVDVMCRVAVNQQNMSEALINLSAMVACEGVPLQLPFFAMLWYEIYQSEQVDRNYIKILCSSNAFIDYVDAVLLDERRSLNNQIIYPFFCNFFPKIYQQVLQDQGRSLLDSIVASIIAEKSALENVETERELQAISYRINADVRALLIIFSVQMPKQISPLLMESLQYILKACRLHQQQRIEAEEQTKLANQKSQEQVEEKETSDTKEEESGETPSKRRRISTEEEDKEDKSKEKECEPSTSAVTDVTEEKSPSSPPDTPSTSTADSNQPSTSTSNRHHQAGLLFNREKPNKVDMVATQIQKLLTLIEKKSTKK